jgi:hypothetical protein
MFEPLRLASHVVDVRLVLKRKRFLLKPFSFLAMIPTEENWPVQSDVPKRFQQETLSLENEAYIHYMRRQAKWFEHKFRRLLMSIVDDLNHCSAKCEAAGNHADQSTHIAELGVDPEKYHLRISSAYNVEQTDGKGTGICGIKFAPIKEFERCFAKAVSFHGESWLEHKPAARYLCDIMRATIYAQDPYVIAIAFAMFKNRCEGLPRVSNYFMDTHVPPDKQTFINTTFRLFDPDTKTEHFAEVLCFLLILT